jgi:hypothetical protein
MAARMQRERGNKGERDGERETETERDRERQREIETGTERDRETETETERDRDGEKGGRGREMERGPFLRARKGTEAGQSQVAWDHPEQALRMLCYAEP